jgi:hypothetical protein
MGECIHVLGPLAKFLGRVVSEKLGVTRTHRQAKRQKAGVFFFLFFFVFHFFASRSSGALRLSDIVRKSNTVLEYFNQSNERKKSKVERGKLLLALLLRPSGRCAAGVTIFAIGGVAELLWWLAGCCCCC